MGTRVTQQEQVRKWPSASLRGAALFDDTLVTRALGVFFSNGTFWAPYQNGFNSFVRLLLVHQAALGP